ncbi:ABC transporter permease [Antarctobacter heliothermus]|uniref:ABC-2 type transport system permease protein n=1 Tax=Antarctobacter heliothermus TaxID=74033 RepID=A0A239F5N0_9RHOB|nr:ABC transporter permease [Antarctobacter heliothermus]SNS51482.1 ABC-2 type transport system permease protein [Antarctobacter heliothermus]
MRRIGNVFWLMGKELRVLWRDLVLLLLVVYSFGPGMYIESSGAGGSGTINNTAVTFVDEDRSSLSRALQTALFPPMFLPPNEARPDEVERMLDWGETTFVVVVPAGFEADVRAGRTPTLQVNIDATKTMQASVGTGYLTAILTAEVQRFAARTDLAASPLLDLVVRRAYNPAGNNVWLSAISGLLNQLSMLTIVLTGAALIREREHGTIEHLMVMPISAVEIALAKISANALVIFVAFVFSLFVVVQGALDIPFAGSETLLMAGTLIYLFAAASIGILLGIVARTMAQLALLIMLVIMPIMILSGGMTPIESQPIWLQPITFLLPSRHYMEFAQAITYRGADFAIVWSSFLWTFLLGALFLGVSLILFRRSVSGG